MPGVKGKTNNPNGRPKGVPNIISRKIREDIADFVAETFPEVIEIWRQIDDPAEKLRAWTNIAEFAVPRMARQEIALSDDDDSTTGIKVEIVRNAKND
jgi:hypothetical protein